MIRTLGTQGAINGAIVAALVILPSLYLSHITNFHLFEEIEYAAMFLVTCVSVYLGISKSTNTSIIQNNYFDGFLKGMIILLISGVTYALVWTIYNGITGHNLEQEYFRMMIQDMKDRGMTQEDIDDAKTLAEYFMHHPVRKFLVTIVEPTMYGIMAPILIPFFVKKKS